MRPPPSRPPTPPPPRDGSTLELLALSLRSDGRVDLLPRRLRTLAMEGTLARFAVDGGDEALSPRMRRRLQATVELGLRAARELAQRSAPLLPDARAVFAWATPLLALEHEELWVLSLDGQSALRADRRVAQGGLHSLSISPAEPLRAALRTAASAFILVHNHPSGDATPSAADIRFTETVSAAARTVDVPLVDHVVVSRGGFVSMLEAGLMR